MMYEYRRRRRRRLNTSRFLLVLTCFLVLAGGAVYIFKGLLFSPLKVTPSPTPIQQVSQNGTPAATLTPTPTPTVWPTPEPMPNETTDPAILNVSWQSPAQFGGSNAFQNAASQASAKNGSTIDYWVFQNNQPVADYQPDTQVAFGTADDYSLLEGVTAFRGNNWRNAPAFGNRTVTEKKLEIVWTHDVGVISAENSIWPGTGWTGQPLLVHWSDEVRNAMNIKPEKKTSDLVEVIYPTLDGNIYFLDLKTGEPTREKIEVGFPMKGTGMVDPRGYPILYVGMGLNENGEKLTEFKYKMFNLLDQSPLYDIFGRDPMAFRDWGAFDSSALLERKSDTFIEAAENGLVYKVKMNTRFDADAKTLQVSPQITKFRYKDSSNPELGIENSPAYYRNYMYFCDNGGTFMCLDINTLKPVWTTHVGDDTDSSTVLEETAEGVYLYTGNQVDKRSQESKSTEDCNIRKLDALTGEVIWEKNYPCIYNFYINGGVLGTPLIGKNDISDLIIYPVCFTGSNMDGKLIAINKKTGEEVWIRDLKAYSWSSPVDILSSDGVTYGIFCDYNGDMHLFDPKTGNDIDVISLGRNIESSPAVYDNMIVVGSYAQKIYGIQIK